jgi:hypothetical protein
VVRYFRNGNLFYISTIAPTLPLLVDVSINSVNGTVTNAIVSNYNTGTFTATASNAGTNPTYQWKLNGSNVGNNSATYTNTALANNDVITCSLTPDLGGCTSSVYNSNSITNKSIAAPTNIEVYALGNVSSGTCNYAEEQVRWKISDLSNVNITGSGNSLTKIQSGGAWNGGAASWNTVSNNGYLEFTATETNTLRMIGLSSSNVNSNFNTIQYAIYLRNDGQVEVYESGSGRGVFGAYTANTIFRIAVDFNVVRYFRNGVLFYTSNVLPTLPLLADVSINSVNGTVSNAIIGNRNAGSFTTSALNVGTNPTYQWKVNGINVGTNNSTYSNTGLLNNDIVTCVVTPDLGGCASTGYTSNSITYKANNNPPPSVTIAITAGTNPSCPGTAITFTATPLNSGSNITYQWTRNGNNISGATSSVYTATLGTNIINGDQIRCVIAVIGVCSLTPTISSNAITVTESCALLGTTLNAVSAFSVRRLTGTYIGNAMQVRRSSDNATLNIGFTAAGELDQAALLAFVGSGDGFVSIWYDQSGNGRNVTATNNTRQPRIVTAGVLNTRNGKPAIVFDGSNDYLQTTSFPTTGFTGFSANVVANWTTTGNTVGNIQVLLDNNHSNSQGFVFQDRPDLTNRPLTMGYVGASGTGAGANDLITTGNSTMRIASMVVDATSLKGYRDGLLFGNAARSGAFGNTNILAIGGWANSGTRNLNGAIPEVLVFNSAISDANREIIECNQSNYYNVTLNFATPSVAVAITSGSNPVCTGNAVTFTATPTNGGTVPAYQWTKNGSNIVGATNPTYTGVAGTDFVNGDLIRCVLTANSNCGNPPTATSTPITMTVNPIVTPTISIAQNIGTLCLTVVSFSSSITNGGTNPTYQWFINSIAVTGATSSTFVPTSPIDGSQVTCQLTSSLTCVTSTLALSNTATLSLSVPSTTWIGNTSSWNTPSNWTNGLPNESTSAIINSGTPNQPLITTAAIVFDVVIDAGATLTIGAGGSLDVHNDFVNNGTFNAGVSTVSFLTCGGNNQQHNIAGSSVTTFNNITLNNTAGLSLDVDANLIGELNLLNGTFTNSASTFTLISNAASTARIAPVAATANFVGNITMQRFAPGPNTGWAHLGTPVQGVTLAQWQDDFMTSGFPGATNNAGGFISIWTYNESTPGLYDANGSYIPASSSTNNIPVGKGFWVYLGTNTNSTADITIDVTGQPTIGNFSFNPSYTNSGDPLNDGFNLIANPYPSTIDWLSSAWTKTNVNNAIYMYQADNTQYASFVGGIGVNGATRHIASSQGFYIQTNGASPVLNIPENAKSSVNAVLIKDEDPANTLRLKVHSDDKTDEMVINLNSNATKAFDGNYDAFKFFNSNSTNPTISSIAVNKDFSINSLPFGGDSMKVPVRVTVGASGMYHISWSGMNKFPLGTCFVIEDLKNGNKSLLDKDGVYYFTEDAGFKSPRFLIHITTPVTYKSTDITCSNINDGSVTVENNAITARKVILKNQAGNFVQEAIVAGNSMHTFTQLTGGTYQLVSPSTSICGDFTQMIEILPAASIAAKFEVSKQELVVNEVVVLNTAQDKGNSLSWNLGDGTIMEGESSIAYHYQTPGEYTVTLTNTKGNCSQSESKVLTVKEAPFTGMIMDVQQANDEFYAVFNFAEITKVNIRLTNALGQEITETLQFEGKNGRVRLPLENNAVGVYMIVLNNGKENVTRKIVKK